MRGSVLRGECVQGGGVGVPGLGLAATASCAASRIVKPASDARSWSAKQTTFQPGPAKKRRAEVRRWPDSNPAAVARCAGANPCCNLSPAGPCSAPRAALPRCPRRSSGRPGCNRRRSWRGAARASSCGSSRGVQTGCSCPAGDVAGSHATRCGQDALLCCNGGCSTCLAPAWCALCTHPPAWN